MNRGRLLRLGQARERKLQRIADKVAARKFLPPNDGDFLLDEIERLEDVVRKQRRERDAS